MFYAVLFSLLLALAIAQCPTTDEITVDFEQDADGNALAPGTIITNQFENLPIGVTITGVSGDSPSQPAMLFDSSNPSPGDEDLGTPNEASGGPGVGDGGADTNMAALGNVLILSEDGSSAVPDDSAAGGTIEFVFAQPISLLSMDVLDIDMENWKIQTFNADDVKLSSTNAIDPGDNSFQRVDINQDNVTRALVTASSSFAISGFSFICDECPNDCNKLTPGVCGCGSSEMDTDGDGSPDCEDLCPEDPDKTEPGLCGCGVGDLGAEHACDCANQVCDCTDVCSTSKVCLCEDFEVCIDVTLECILEIILDLGVFTVDPGQGPRKRQTVEKTTLVLDRQNDEFSVTYDEDMATVTKYEAVKVGTVSSGEQNKVSSITGSTNGGVREVVSLLLIALIAVLMM